MPRSARIVVPGAAHHVTQRGHNRCAVFHNDIDRRSYLSLLQEHAAAADCRIAGYCLMTNHVHLVVVPQRAEGLSAMMRGINTKYGSGFNRRSRRVGAIWQGRFYSCPMDYPHAINALCYVELNPVRAGMAESTEFYEWSSAGHTWDCVSVRSCSICRGGGGSGTRRHGGRCWPRLENVPAMRTRFGTAPAVERRWVIPRFWNVCRRFGQTWGCRSSGVACWGCGGQSLALAELGPRTVPLGEISHFVRDDNRIELTGRTV
ncbi:MAG: transposase [Candidatus Hydrogenedentes bacterium]|nr:transposase [Candidatus Hydrogenedentota bacterium]